MYFSSSPKNIYSLSAIVSMSKVIRKTSFKLLPITTRVSMLPAKKNKELILVIPC
jgi:hypothetical protein